MEPLRRFPPDLYTDALESWYFVDLSGKRPLFTSPFGDVFFQSESGFWFLDVVSGELSCPWPSEGELGAELNSRAGQDQYLMTTLAAEAESAGKLPGPDEIYSFTVPPVLGGAMEVSNVDVCSFVVGLNLAGQIHDQVRTLPPGTPICEVSII